VIVSIKTDPEDSKATMDVNINDGDVFEDIDTFKGDGELELTEDKSTKLKIGENWNGIVHSLEIVVHIGDLDISMYEVANLRDRITRNNGK
jgi:hypothetical protein